MIGVILWLNIFVQFPSPSFKFQTWNHRPCYSDGLGEGHDRDAAFASALETFGGGHNDPTCVSFGGKTLIFFFLGCGSHNKWVGTYQSKTKKIKEKKRIKEKTRGWVRGFVGHLFLF